MEPITERPSERRPGEPGPRPTDRRWILVALAALVLAAVVALVVVSLQDDGDDASLDTGTTTTQPATSSTTAEPPATSGASTTSTSPPTSTGAVRAEEAATVVWPDALAGAGLADPDELARAFATEGLGFDDPIVGEYQAGDSRSGELEVRPLDDGPVTTIGVRRMSDDRFYVVFATTSEVELILPTPGSAVDSPLEVEGWGRGFEGRIRITVHDRSTGRSLGEGFVSAGGTGELEAFRGDVTWEGAGGGWGFVVASVSGGDDATTWAATALPVGFIGGD